MIQFDLPKEQSSIIKVIGVGGGGSNAVNHMFAQSIEGVNFIICNTDAQAIAQSKVPNKIQLGPHLTQGLGAGANPAIGRQATEESLDEIKRILEVNTKMAFITAGMGGGTGTGGAPILAKICKDLGILTVGIVTTPFAYEGKKRIAQAEEGVLLLKNHVDTLLVISNDKLRHQFGNLKMKEAFAKADNVLATAAKCITDVINSTGQINVDFADVCTVMSNGGVAILGSASVAGENRAQLAIENALSSPLLNDNDIRGAKWILININSAEGEHEHTMDEVEIIQNYLLNNAGEDTDVILGLGYDNTLENKIGITLIATGFEHKDPFAKKPEVAVVQNDDEKIMMTLEMPSKEQQAIKPVKILQQHTLQFADEDAIVVTNNTTSTNEIKVDEMMPKLVEPDKAIKQQETNNTVEKEDNTPVFYEISSATDQIPVIAFDIPSPTIEKEKATPKSVEKTNVAEQKFVTQINSGVFLSKPKQIYAQEPLKELVEKTTPTQNAPISDDAKEEKTEMHLVLKTDTQTQETAMQNTVVAPVTEIPASQDENEDLRKKAFDRINKLRNLSFNINATDPNNEFEMIPAYLRRNLELHSSIAEVENFYSNYTVKADENNQVEISTINTFLEGKKPD